VLGAKTSAGYGAFELRRLAQPSSGDDAPAGGGASPRGESAVPGPPVSSETSGSYAHALIGQVRSLPASRIASEINTFVDECLKLEAPVDQKALVQAIVEKVTVRYIRDRIRDRRRPEQWRPILELAGIEMG